MPNTPDVTTPYLDAGPVEDDSIVPINPFYALRYQFGMLLGVEDFDAAQAYARGKTRLHNAWLHRAGVVWGFGVTAPPVSITDPTLRGEIQVDPGLALDSLGHELHLDAAACINVGAWYAKHKSDAGFPQLDPVTGGAIPARVEVRFRACLARQVPAMSEPCEGGSAGTAYSRAFETVEIRLVPDDLAAPPVASPYHLLRVLFGLETAAAPPTDHEQAVLDALAAIAVLPLDQQARAFLAAFRRFAALDVIGLRPGHSADLSRTLLVPGEEDAPVLLARINLGMKPDTTGGGFHLDTAVIDPTVRPSHVATSTIQELNLIAATGVAPAALGPRFDRATLAVTPSGDVANPGIVIKVGAVGPLDPRTVDQYSFAVLYMEPAVTWGWATAGIAAAQLGAGNTVSVTVTPPPPAGSRVRFIARGSGPWVLLGENGWPLDGATDEPRRGTEYNGKDFVHMWIIQEDS